MFAPFKCIFFNFKTEVYLNLVFFWNCQPKTCSFWLKPCTQLLIQHHFQKFAQLPNWIYDFHRLFKTVEGFQTFLSQNFGTKVFEGFLKLNHQNEGFQSFSKVQHSETKDFKGFLKVGTSCPRLPLRWQCGHPLKLLVSFTGMLYWVVTTFKHPLHFKYIIFLFIFYVRNWIFLFAFIKH